MFPAMILIQEARAPSIQLLPINLNGPLQYYFNGPQYKWAPKKDIDPGGLGPLNLIFANDF